MIYKTHPELPIAIVIPRRRVIVVVVLVRCLKNLPSSSSPHIVAVVISSSWSCHCGGDIAVISYPVVVGDGGDRTRTYLAVNRH